MTPATLKAARRQLGWSCEGMAKALGIQSGRTVRRWEAGTIPVPGPVTRLLGIWLEHPKLAPEIRRGRPPNASETVGPAKELHASGDKFEAAIVEQVGKMLAHPEHCHAWTPYTDGETDWDECEECGAQQNERPIEE